MAKNSNVLMNESFFGRKYWNPILNVLFPPSGDFELVLEARLKSIDKGYPDLKADYAVQLLVDRYDDSFPVLIAEFSKEPLDDLTSIHKDEEKLACMMACSLFKIIGALNSASRDEIRSLACYGLLLGAFDFEIFTISSDFDTNGSMFFVFTTSRQQWRFSILKDAGRPNSAPEEGFLVCKGIKKQMANLKPSQLATKDSSSSSDPLMSIDDVEFVEVDWYDYIADHVDQSQKSKIAERLFYLHRSGVTDNVGLGVLIRLRDLILAQMAQIRRIAGIGPFPPSDPAFVFPKFKVRQIDAGRKAKDSMAPLLTSSKYQSFSHEDSFTIEKHLNTYELCIYRLPEVSQSHCFPKLIDFMELPKGFTALFCIESVIPLNKFEGPLECVITAFSELLEAVKVLHSAGFVHGDISPGNIGYNLKAQRWQLFDFDQARPIEEAAVKLKWGGTELFRSTHYELTGWFRPTDDFISLKLSVFWWLESKLLDEECSAAKKQLKNLVDAIDACEPMDVLALQASKLTESFDCQVVPQ
jgi:hypothetical protein